MQSTLRLGITYLVRESFFQIISNYIICNDETHPPFLPYIIGRMPLAYVQLVQILVDTLVWLAPISLYSGLGSLSIPLCGLLTLFFKGLLELSKSFLDPFGNEGYPGQNIRVDVLVSELNFGASNRWVKAGEFLPKR